MKIETLNCPNCGAGVASDSSVCEFCRTRLKTVACPKCLGLMFFGSKFCGHCGAEAAKAEIAQDQALGKCPRCKVDLVKLDVGSTDLRQCERCDGMWADVDTFETICADRERQSAVLFFIDKKQAIQEGRPKISYVPSPDCGQLMNRSNFAQSSGVIIDVCKHHGVWFDADELPKIISFIQRGGMEMAREKERMDLDAERERLRDEQSRITRENQRMGSGGPWESDDALGIGQFVRKLFE